VVGDSIGAVSERCGVGVNQIALIEKGKRRVLATEIKQLAVGYRLDPCTVLFLY
jgi:hypothetical protein